MPCVLQITWRKDGAKVPGLFGNYVREYNPRLDSEETYLLIVVTDIEDAKRFDTEQEALMYYHQVSPNRPRWEHTGLPNKPLADGWVAEIRWIS